MVATIVASRELRKTAMLRAMMMGSRRCHDGVESSCASLETASFGEVALRLLDCVSEADTAEALRRLIVVGDMVLSLMIELVSTRSSVGSFAVDMSPCSAIIPWVKPLSAEIGS